MAKGIEIGVGADTKAFKQGMETGVIQPIDDAAMALTDLGNNQGPEKLEQSLEGAQDATENLKRETKETADAIERDFRDSYRSVNKSSDDGISGARRGLDDFKSEAGSTARESAASFDGSAQSIADSFQEVAANSFVGFGPAGAAAGIAAAAGIGIAGAAMEENERRAQKMAEETVDAFDRMIEAGGKFYTKDAENSLIREAVRDPEKAKQILEISKLTGISEGYVARAVALTGQERQKVIDRLNEVYDINNKTISQGEGFTDVLVEQNGKISEQVGILGDRNKAEQNSADLARIYDEATGGVLAKRESENEEIRIRNRLLASTPDTKKIKLVVDDSEIDKALRKPRVLNNITIGTVRAGQRAI